jgi:leucyl/phenylalanyl-tRNA---protein transferase
MAPVFPDPRKARPDGLGAVGGTLSVETLIAAYSAGFFPWTSRPVTWWSPDPRGVLDLDAVHIPRSLARVLRLGRYRVTFDVDFPAVIRACAAVPRRDGATWISADFIEAYIAMHRAGLAHSAEVWEAERLVGGVYGVAVGGLFSGESMFHLAADASKVGLVRLAERLRAAGFELFDTQMVTDATRRLGAREIPREAYLDRLRHAVAKSAAF